MTVEMLLEQFYADLILVKRAAQKTAMTYKISAEEFLHWLVEQQIKLRDVSALNLVYFLTARKTQGCSELTIAKDISAMRAFGDYLVRKNYWTENYALMLDSQRCRVINGGKEFFYLF